MRLVLKRRDMVKTWLVKEGAIMATKVAPTSSHRVGEEKRDNTSFFGMVLDL